MKLRSFFLVNLSILVTLMASKNTAVAASRGAETISHLAVERRGNFVLSNTATGTGSATNSGIMAPSDRSMLYHTNPNTLYKVDYNQRLSLEDIKAMSQSKIRDGVIIEKINTTQSHYTLNNDQIRDLRASGVSRRVIDAIQKNPQNTNQRQYQQESRYQDSQSRYQDSQQRYQQPYQKTSPQYQRSSGLQQNYQRSGNLFKRTYPGPYYQRGG